MVFFPWYMRRKFLIWCVFRQKKDFLDHSHKGYQAFDLCDL